MGSKTKRCALRIRGGVRTRIDLMQLRKGDIFVFAEEDGTPVAGGRVCVAYGKPHKEDGYTCVEYVEQSGDTDETV